MYFCGAVAVGWGGTARVGAAGWSMAGAKKVGVCRLVAIRQAGVDNRQILVAIRQIPADKRH
ncbi:hypothetical protein AS29_008130 [Bacillus sp. SJS]|nr:hypothetical protein AS29_008130 [Bacillus sp. SJS]